MELFHENILALTIFRRDLVEILFIQKLLWILTVCQNVNDMKKKIVEKKFF